jgi:hypothetical protein
VTSGYCPRYRYTLIATLTLGNLYYICVYFFQQYYITQSGFLHASSARGLSYYHKQLNKSSTAHWVQLLSHLLGSTTQSYTELYYSHHRTLPMPLESPNPHRIRSLTRYYTVDTFNTICPICLIELNRLDYTNKVLLSCDHEVCYYCWLWWYIKCHFREVPCLLCKTINTHIEPEVFGHPVAYDLTED